MKALAAKRTKGCGEFWWRASRDGKVFLVYCTRDGKSWTGRIVTLSTGNVSEPLSQSSMTEVPPPKQ